ARQMFVWQGHATPVPILSGSCPLALFVAGLETSSVAECSVGLQPSRGRSARRPAFAAQFFARMNTCDQTHASLLLMVRILRAQYTLGEARLQESNQPNRQRVHSRERAASLVKSLYPETGLSDQ